MTSHFSIGTILLDDATATTDRKSRLYENPKRVLKAYTLSSAQEVVDEISLAQKNGQYVVALLNYELGLAIQNLYYHPNTLLLEAYIYDNVNKLKQEEVEEYLKHRSSSEPAGLLGIEHSIDQDEFSKAISRIQELIRDGQTYQVNFTYPITGYSYGSPVDLYQGLKNQQPAPFGAFIVKENGYVLSFSPEWFIQHQQGKLCAKPMKGTAKASESGIEELQNDPKNRAENLMIVDLLRNDLGKVSESGSVEVPTLFEVTQHGQVLQMTSTVTSTMKRSTSLWDVLQAVFPCGSVTGAPKRKTMEIISELENTPRGLYCGAIAWFDPTPNEQDQGDFAMSVVIRTLEIDRQNQFQMGVGSGITIDSNAADEWRECQIKTSFITARSQLGLFETIRVENRTPQLLEDHLNRLRTSAQSLRIPFDRQKIIEQLHQHTASLNLGVVYRLRLDLDPVGTIQIQTTPLPPLMGQQKVLLASNILESYQATRTTDLLLQHKVTRRGLYDIAWKKAEERGCFDAIFINEQGHLTEGGRTNLFIKQEGNWYTPPLSDGCLAGVMRSRLLKDPQMKPSERSLTIDDLMHAEEIILCNALRGAIPVIIES